MSERDDWWVIHQYLYNGISDRIRWYKDHQDLATPEEMGRLKEALDVYRDNCVVSGKSLDDAYEALCGSLAQQLLEEDQELEF